MNSLNDAIRSVLNDAVPNGFSAVERDGAWNPAPGKVDFLVRTPNVNQEAMLLDVVVEVDVWARGPSTVQANQVANTVEATLHGFVHNSPTHGTVRLFLQARAPIPEGDSPKLTHIALSFVGRAFRRI
jgi:hypothetical protein